MICSKDVMSKLKTLKCDHVMALTNEIQAESYLVEYPGRLMFSC